MGHRQGFRVAVLALTALAAFLPLRRAHGGSLPAAPTTAPRLARASAPPDAPGFTFDPTVTALNRQAFLQAVTRMRPEAVALAGRVDGLVTVQDVAPQDGALGLTISRSTGYTIQLKFGRVYHDLGRRGFDRVIDHELGHVVDHALLTPQLNGELDAGIPPGQPCAPGGHTGACAPREERFAETFAKWATGDLGIDIYAGYAVPPPADLEAWGQPLAA